MSALDRPRSASFFGERGTPHGFTARAFTKAMGFTDDDLQKPVIGIAQTWSELNHCNSHFRERRRGGQARRLAGRRLPARVPDHLAGRGPHQARRRCSSAT